ncbi:hypothetical protein EDC01DRAFT_652860 [Geopyxis carbonaria]|nr:hypothetical protein EDC01DRAFT_652860 [Geopyxis carbonaria]
MFFLRPTSALRPLRPLLATLTPAAARPLQLPKMASTPLIASAFAAQKRLATFNQVKRGCRKAQRARKPVSPALSQGKRPCMKGVCLKVTVMKPKKPNSAERKIARVKLSNDRLVTAYIPGEGHNVQQHSVVLVRGGRAQDCPGVKYHLIRGAMDLGGVPNRITSRSKYGTKKTRS